MKQLACSILLVLSVSVAVLSSSKIIPHVYNAKCVGCEDCVKHCPKKGAIYMVRGKAVVNPEKCIGCDRCINACGYGAVRQ